jgi:hypothetical protein
MGNSSGAKPSVSPDGRWLIANVSKGQDRRISVVWPRVGCLGNALDGQSTKQEADCVKYIEIFVMSHRYFDFGNAKDQGGFDIWNESIAPKTHLHCHQVKEDEEPH